MLRELPQRTRWSGGKGLLHRISRDIASYREALRPLLGAENAEPAAIIDEFERVLVPKRRQLEEVIEAFIAHKQERLQRGYEEARSEASKAVTFAAALLGLALLVSAGFASTIGRNLARAYRSEQSALKKAEQALRARDELLGIVAHDLRSPVTAILLKAAHLQHSSEVGSTRRQAASIEGTAARLEYVIKSLLDSASLEAGKFSVKQGPCDVEAILHETVEMLDGVASSKAVRLRRRALPSRLGVLADRERLLQVLTNLVGNAIKFTPDGGEVEVSAEPDGPSVRFSVADTGPGISRDDLPHLFERFWKADKSGRKGTGLGLYIAKGIVEAHGGRIWVESEVGHGAKVFFTVPSCEVPRTTLGQMPGHRPPAHA